MRHIRHPGPPFAERSTAVAGVSIPLNFVLEPGNTVDAAIAGAFASAGCTGGFVMLRGGACKPFRFVIPAAAPDGRHAAWYSDTIAPVGPVEIERVGVIVGQRNGEPFVHCHGIWKTPDGVRMGHLLAPDSVVSDPIEATGIGLKEAVFEGSPDLETGFTLFEPMSTGGSGEKRAGARALLARVRPNEDISIAIERICTRHGIESANVYGIGSLNEVRFADGGSVDSYATEVLVHKGKVEAVDGQPRVHLLIDVVDMKGEVFSGTLTRADNPVCVTFELLIEETDHR